MSEETLDCRGLACPSPVMKTRQILERGDVDRLAVLVDNRAARENVSRFLGRSGYDVNVEGVGEIFTVTGTRSGAVVQEGAVKEHAREDKSRVLVLVGTDRLGTGDDALGRKLIVSFIGTLKEMQDNLWRLIFLNGGVKLTVEGSEVLSHLRELEEVGVHIMVCGTCLNHFGILDDKRVGETTNMLDIVTAMQLADKVMSIT